MKSQDLWDEFYVGKKNLKSKMGDTLGKKVNKMFSTMQVPVPKNSTNELQKVMKKSSKRNLLDYAHAKATVVPPSAEKKSSVLETVQPKPLVPPP